MQAGVASKEIKSKDAKDRQKEIQAGVGDMAETSTSLLVETLAGSISESGSLAAWRPKNSSATGAIPNARAASARLRVVEKIGGEG